MNPASDLRPTRICKGLRIEDLASPMLRPATVSEIENGLYDNFQSVEHILPAVTILGIGYGFLSIPNKDVFEQNMKRKILHLSPSKPI